MNSRLATTARDRGVPLVLVNLAEPAARELYDRDYALIRPDQHVAWRGDRLPDNADDLLDHLTGTREPGAV